MAHRQYRHLLGLDAVNDAIAVVDEFSHIGLIQLRHNSPALRKRRQCLGRVENLIDPVSCSLWIVAGNETRMFAHSLHSER